MNQNNPKEISAEELNRWLQNDSSKPLLVDVREKQELLIAPFPEKVLNLLFFNTDIFIGNFVFFLGNSTLP